MKLMFIRTHRLLYWHGFRIHARGRLRPVVAYLWFFGQAGKVIFKKKPCSRMVTPSIRRAPLVLLDPPEGNL
jgi:hypothetical protein